MDVNLFIPFWNRKDLPSPALISVTIPSQKPNQVSNLIAKGLLDISESLKIQWFRIRIQRAFLQKFECRMKHSFRNDKGFKILSMVNRTLKNFDFERFSENFNSVIRCVHDDKGPTKQMLQWLLINVQRIFALFCRVYNLSFESASLFYSRFYSGHHFHIAAIALAILSKIWLYCKTMLLEASNWNGTLISFLPHSSFVGEKWLPKGEKIHKDLILWLNPPDILREVKKQKQNKTEMTLEEVDGSVAPCTFFNEDVGETLNGPEQPEEKNIFKTLEDIISFIDSEKKKRSGKRFDAKTKSINTKQWNRFCHEATEAFKRNKFNKNSRIYKKIINDFNDKICQLLK